MKIFTSLSFLVLITFYSSAQVLRVSLGSGIANYSGDIQQKWFTTKGSKPFLSIGASVDVANHILVRADVTFTNLAADDKNNSDPALTARNLNFKTSITDISLVGEYDLFTLQKHRITPYVFAGIGAFHFNPFTTGDKDEKVFLKPLSTEGQGLPEYPNRKPYSLTQMNIPYGAGLKWSITDDLQFGAELSLRKLFTDYVDDLSTTYVDQSILLNRVGPDAVRYSYRGDEIKNDSPGYPNENSIRGNSGQKDSYYFARIRLNLRIGWLTNDDITSGNIVTNKKSLRCPW